MDEEGVSTYHDDFVTCPFCQEQHFNVAFPEAEDDESHIVRCEYCQKNFHVVIHIATTYSSYEKAHDYFGF